ncbi:MAG TPA: hypothetical protein VFF06_12690 [Polyangia bacterium]|nr:hypothetical protein [Polyangia bacterium]
MLVGIRAAARRAPGVLVALALAAAGCGYTSEYAPPLDGRARPVWKDNNVVMELSGGGLTPACTDEIVATTQYKRLRLSSGDLRLDGGYWAPRYYGPQIVVITPGLAPPLPVVPLFVPHLPVGAHATFVGAPGVRVNGGSGGGGGSSGGDALAKLAVIALVVLPAVALGLAIANPESSTRSSQAIDEVNVYNDLVRSGQSACAQAPFDVGGGS